MANGLIKLLTFGSTQWKINWLTDNLTTLFKAENYEKSRLLSDTPQLKTELHFLQLII